MGQLRVYSAFIPLLCVASEVLRDPTGQTTPWRMPPTKSKRNVIQVPQPHQVHAVHFELHDGKGFWFFSGSWTCSRSPLQLPGPAAYFNVAGTGVGEGRETGRTHAEVLGKQ